MFTIGVQEIEEFSVTDITMTIKSHLSTRLSRKLENMMELKSNPLNPEITLLLLYSVLKLKSINFQMMAVFGLGETTTKDN
jgi:hypothetical protein